MKKKDTFKNRLSTNKQEDYLVSLASVSFSIQFNILHLSIAPLILETSLDIPGVNLPVFWLTAPTLRITPRKSVVLTSMTGSRIINVR